MQKRILISLALLITATARAQQTIGTVLTENATISGTVSISNQKATIANAGIVEASLNRTAEVQLTRGGTINVCSTSTLHLSQSTAAVATPALLLALDRGAIELHLPITPGDAVITPDLRFEFSSPAPLDLRIRVTPNGDTCVDNHGKLAPTLHVTQQFGVDAYFIKPGQHPLFEHGSLREVVDSESTPCGCPAPTITINNAATPTDPHPFPYEISAGLAPAPPVPQAPPGNEHVQVSTTLHHNAGDPKPAPLPPAPAPSPITNEPPKDLAHAIGHFFKRLFGKK